MYLHNTGENSEKIDTYTLFIKKQVIEWKCGKVYMIC